jgi:iron complex transport system substrate-binding protein
MKASIALAILLWVLATLFSPGLVRAVEIVDDLGRTVSLGQPAKRIIPLYGAFTEMLFAIGAGGQVVARTQSDHYPEEIVELPSVGTHMRPNVEIILGLKPDLVVLSGSRGEASVDVDRLLDASIPVAVFEPKSFDAIFSVMKRLGVLTGRDGDAASSVARLGKRLEEVKTRLADVKERPRVFFEVRAEPLTGAGRGAIVQQILAGAGAENVLKTDKAIVRYNIEALLLDDPDVYIVQQGPMNRNPPDPRKRVHLDRLRSVKAGRIIFVDELLFSRPGPRCVDAVEKLAASLYPDLFKSGGG